MKDRLFNKNLAKVKKIGGGAYGTVYKTYDISEKDKPDEQKNYIVVKKMENKLFIEGINFSALREIKILKEIKHKNILELLDVFYDRTNLYLSYELLDFDLSDLIINSKNIILNESIIKSIMLQIFVGIDVVHKHNVIHRDLKPHNILISKTKGLLKIADFGMARYMSSYERGMTKNLVTPWYRSPELFFGSSSYSTSADIWSIGCIMGELYQKEPLFPGDGDIQILTKIFYLLGIPNEVSLADSNNNFNNNNNNNDGIDYYNMKFNDCYVVHSNNSNCNNNIDNSYNHWEGVSELINFKTFVQGDVVGIKNYFNTISKEAIDLLEKCLHLDPLKRITAENAINHEYFKSDPKPLNIDDLKSYFNSLSKNK